MIKRTLLALACAAMMLPAAASWTPGDNTLTPLGENHGLEYQEPVMIRKADGSTILVYRTLGTHKNPETQQMDPQGYFYLHLQMLDPAGNRLLGDEGAIVSHKPTLRAAYDYVNADTLANGNVLLTHSDVRHMSADQLQEEHLLAEQNLDTYFPNGIRTYAYCYTQTGDTVWSKDGVEMPYYVMDSTAIGRLYGQEQLVPSGNYIYFASQMMEKFLVEDTTQSFDPIETFVHYFEIVCMDLNGNILKQQIDTVVMAYRFAMRPAPNGNVYLVYVDENEGYSAQLLNPDLQNVWGEPVVVEPFGVVTHDGTTQLAEKPSEAIILNDNSLALVYKAFRASDGNSQLYYNRLYPNGTVLGHTMLTDTIGTTHEHVIMLDGDTLVVFNLQEHPVSSRHMEFYLYYNRILLNGQPLYDMPYGYWLSEETQIDMDLLGVIRNGDYYELLSNDVDYHHLEAPSYSYTISVDGKKVFRKPIINKDLYVNDIAFTPDGTYANIVFTKEMYGAQGLWQACIDVADHTNSAPETGELPGKFSVSADGKQVQFSKGNLQFLPRIPTFHFATAQFEVMLNTNTFLKYTDVNWMDLFGWGDGEDPDNYSGDNADYPTFNEWGNHSIINSSYDAGTWRTLSAEEWDYILNGRPDAASKRGLASLDYHPLYDQFALLILPDTFKLPGGLSFNPAATNFDENKYEPRAWKKMQDAGAVFLTLNGYRTDTTIVEYDHVKTRGVKGHYWTTTESGASQAIALSIDQNGPVLEARDRSQGLGVRLVKDVEVDPQGIEDVVITEKDGKVRKVIVNGQLYIIRDGRIYNATGAEVK